MSLRKYKPKRPVETLEVDPRTNASILEDKLNAIGLSMTTRRVRRPVFLKGSTIKGHG